MIGLSLRIEPPPRCFDSLGIMAWLIRKDFKRQVWISPEIGELVMSKCYAIGSLDSLYEANGWGGIRTPGAFQHTRFPGVHNQPLCHPSKMIFLFL